VNDPDEMESLIDLGVDGIITDRPDVLMSLLGR
jgi:glycerophosphoryl diester phosphodiesterase